jgi:hypothetical protein
MRINREVYIMPNDKELAYFIMNQLNELGDVRTIPMMGGYIFHMYYELPDRKTKKKGNKPYESII